MRKPWHIFGTLCAALWLFAFPSACSNNNVAPSLLDSLPPGEDFNQSPPAGDILAQFSQLARAGDLDALSLAFQDIFAAGGFDDLVDALSIILDSERVDELADIFRSIIDRGTIFEFTPITSDMLVTFAADRDPATPGVQSAYDILSQLFETGTLTELIVPLRNLLAPEFPRDNDNVSDPRIEVIQIQLDLIENLGPEGLQDNLDQLNLILTPFSGLLPPRQAYLLQGNDGSVALFTAISNTQVDDPDNVNPGTPSTLSSPNSAFRVFGADALPTFPAGACTPSAAVTSSYQRSYKVRFVTGLNAGRVFNIIRVLSETQLEICDVSFDSSVDPVGSPGPTFALQDDAFFRFQIQAAVPRFDSAGAVVGYSPAPIGAALHSLHSSLPISNKDFVQGKVQAGDEARFFSGLNSGLKFTITVDADLGLPYDHPLYGDIVYLGPFANSGQPYRGKDLGGASDYFIAERTDHNLAFELMQLNLIRDVLPIVERIVSGQVDEDSETLVELLLLVDLIPGSEFEGDDFVNVLEAVLLASVREDVNKDGLYDAFDNLDRDGNYGCRNPGTLSYYFWFEGLDSACAADFSDVNNDGVAQQGETFDIDGDGTFGATDFSREELLRPANCERAKFFDRENIVESGNPGACPPGDGFVDCDIFSQPLACNTFDTNNDKVLDSFDMLPVVVDKAGRAGIASGFSIPDRYPDGLPDGRLDWRDLMNSRSITPNSFLFPSAANPFTLNDNLSRFSQSMGNSILDIFQSEAGPSMRRGAEALIFALDNPANLFIDGRALPRVALEDLGRLITTKNLNTGEFIIGPALTTFYALMTDGPKAFDGIHGSYEPRYLPVAQGQSVKAKFAQGGSSAYSGLSPLQTFLTPITAEAGIGGQKTFPYGTFEFLFKHGVGEVTCSVPSLRASDCLGASPSNRIIRGVERDPFSNINQSVIHQLTAYDDRPLEPAAVIVAIRTLTPSFAYNLTVEGTPVSYVSSAAPTGTEIAAGLASAIATDPVLGPTVKPAAVGPVLRIESSPIGGLLAVAGGPEFVITQGPLTPAQPVQAVTEAAAVELDFYNEVVNNTSGGTLSNLVFFPGSDFRLAVPGDFLIFSAPPVGGGSPEPLYLAACGDSADPLDPSNPANLPHVFQPEQGPQGQVVDLTTTVCDPSSGTTCDQICDQFQTFDFDPPSLLAPGPVYRDVDVDVDLIDPATFAGINADDELRSVCAQQDLVCLRILQVLGTQVVLVGLDTEFEDDANANGITDTPTLTVAVASAQNTTTYSVTINSTVYSFTSDDSSTPPEISDGLADAINAGTDPVIAFDQSGTVFITGDRPGVVLTASVGANLTLSVGGSGQLETGVPFAVDPSDLWPLVDPAGAVGGRFYGYLANYLERLPRQVFQLYQFHQEDGHIPTFDGLPPNFDLSNVDLSSALANSAPNFRESIGQQTTLMLPVIDIDGEIPVSSALDLRALDLSALTPQQQQTVCPAGTVPLLSCSSQFLTNPYRRVNDGLPDDQILYTDPVELTLYFDIPEVYDDHILCVPGSLPSSGQPNALPAFIEETAELDGDTLVPPPPSQNFDPLLDPSIAGSDATLCQNLPTNPNLGQPVGAGNCVAGAGNCEGDYEVRRVSNVLARLLPIIADISPETSDRMIEDTEALTGPLLASGVLTSEDEEAVLTSMDAVAAIARTGVVPTLSRFAGILARPNLEDVDVGGAAIEGARIFTRRVQLDNGETTNNRVVFRELEPFLAAFFSPDTQFSQDLIDLLLALESIPVSTVENFVLVEQPGLGQSCDPAGYPLGACENRNVGPDLTADFLRTMSKPQPLKNRQGVTVKDADGNDILVRPLDSLPIASDDFFSLAVDCIHGLDAEGNGTAIFNCSSVEDPRQLTTFGEVLTDIVIILGNVLQSEEFSRDITPFFSSVLKTVVDLLEPQRGNRRENPTLSAVRVFTGDSSLEAARQISDAFEKINQSDRSKLINFVVDQFDPDTGAIAAIIEVLDPVIRNDPNGVFAQAVSDLIRENPALPPIQCSGAQSIAARVVGCSTKVLGDIPEEDIRFLFDTYVELVDTGSAEAIVNILSQMVTTGALERVSPTLLLMSQEGVMDEFIIFQTILMENGIIGIDQ
ncbi:MAG: hypothetical protein AB1405_00945 [Bdellovibrionota bacterium]